MNDVFKNGAVDVTGITVEPAAIYRFFLNRPAKIAEGKGLNIEKFAERWGQMTGADWEPQELVNILHATVDAINLAWEMRKQDRRAWAEKILKFLRKADPKYDAQGEASEEPEKNKPPIADWYREMVPQVYALDAAHLAKCIGTVAALTEYKIKANVDFVSAWLDSVLQKNIEGKAKLLTFTDAEIADSWEALAELADQPNIRNNSALSNKIARFFADTQGDVKTVLARSEIEMIKWPKLWDVYREYAPLRPGTVLGHFIVQKAPSKVQRKFGLS